MRLLHVTLPLSYAAISSEVKGVQADDGDDNDDGRGSINTGLEKEKQNEENLQNINNNGKNKYEKPKLSMYSMPDGVHIVKPNFCIIYSCKCKIF